MSTEEHDSTRTNWVKLNDYDLIEPKVKDTQDLYSEHDNILVISSKTLKLEMPLLTVELYEKWYSLYLITKGYNKSSKVDWLKVYAITYDQLEPYRKDGELLYLDHVPNPKAVRRFAKGEGYRLDILAEELLEGRWFLEVDPAKEVPVEEDHAV